MFKSAKFESKELVPHLGKNGLAIFEKYVSNSACYLEYGSGGSTLRAHNLGAKHIISVDSSKDWTLAIQNNLNHSPNADLLYCDIGLVGRWGKPTKEGKLQNYHTYMSSPWTVAQEKDLNVDLVMIDGRFRVACFLYSLLCAEPGTVILFDDYLTRPRYHVVEKFCTKTRNYGRMAEFHVKKDYNLPELVAYISKYSIIKD